MLKRTLADRLFSDFIRTRDGWRCTRCGTQYEPPTKALHCSHYFGRSRQNVRFDPVNADAHCYGCHRFLGSSPSEFREWKRARIGDRAFAMLEERANTYRKANEEEARQMVRALFLDLAEGRIQKSDSQSGGAGS